MLMTMIKEPMTQVIAEICILGNRKRLRRRRDKTPAYRLRLQTSRRLRELWIACFRNETLDAFIL